MHWNKKILIIIFTLSIQILFGDISLLLTPENGQTAFERNSNYKVTLQAVPSQETTVGAIGEIYIEYNTDIFEPITSFAQDYHQLPSNIWESEKVSFNHLYNTNAEYQCIEYSKTDNNGPFWTINNTSNITALTFKVKENAPTGDTTISFIYTANNNKTKMIDSTGKVIPLTVKDLEITIELDNTPPTTLINVPGGVLNAPPDVKLQPNEDSLVHYTVVGGANIPEEQLVSKNQWSSAINIPGSEGEVKYSTIYYYSEDFAQDKNHNIENETAYVFTIDMQDPDISNIKVPTQGIPVGAVAEIHFDAYDSVAIQNISVSIGGEPAYLYSGSGNDTYIFRKTISGNEDSNGLIQISVTDSAGNTTTNAKNNIVLDFGGPEFTNISINPDPAQINQEVIISFNASETLKENPAVKIGNNNGYYVSKSNNNYLYRYTVTANGWYVDLSFAQDNNAPFTERNLAPKYATGSPKNTSIYFKIGDNQNSIDTENMTILLNGITCYQQGSFQNCDTLQSRITQIEGSPHVFLVPDSPFSEGSVVNVNLSIPDSQANTLNEFYYFSIGTSLDIAVPVIENNFPSNQSEDIEIETPLYFEIKDIGKCGIARDRINFDMVESISNNMQQKTITSNVITNGIFNEGFSGSIIPDTEGNYVVSVIPSQGLKANATITCLVEAEDIAQSSNQTTYNWSFNTISCQNIDSDEKRQPLAWPTIFNPLDENNNKQMLTFNLKDKEETTIRMYDLSGDMIWEYVYDPTNIGFQSVAWYGKNARDKIVGNGVFIWYVIQNNKVVCHGKSIVMK